MILQLYIFLITLTLPSPLYLSPPLPSPLHPLPSPSLYPSSPLPSTTPPPPALLAGLTKVVHSARKIYKFNLKMEVLQI